MNKKYIKPELEITDVDTMAIIATSIWVTDDPADSSIPAEAKKLFFDSADSSIPAEANNLFFEGE